MLVVAATERELALLDGLDTFCCGIGPVEAALQTARALEERKPDAVVHAGIAGSRTLEPPALVLGSEAVYCDVIDPASTLPRVERARPDAALLERARAALPEAHVLPIATCGKVGGGTDFDVEAMEGFGVLRACELAGVPGRRAACDLQLAGRGRPGALAVRRRVRRARRRATPTRRRLGTRRCRGASVRRRRGRGSPRRSRCASGAACRDGRLRRRPGSTSTRSHGSPSSIVSVPRSGTKTSS